MHWAIGALALVLGLPGAATAIHLGLLAAASLAPRRIPAVPDPPRVRFLIMIPAHNEAAVISTTLAAITAERRPGDQVLVVADRCTDTTASIAREAGARVVERGSGEPPGRAEARQAGIAYALSRPESWDALVMIDADSEIEPGFLAACEAALATGAEALQVRSEAALGPRLLDQLALAASSIQGIVMPRGRARLGLLVRLRGTGMVLTKPLVSRFRFRAAASEDLHYSLELCLAGIHPMHVEQARLRSLNAGSWKVAGDQRVRYEAGRMDAARRFVPDLLRRHDRASLEAAWFLMTPPFAAAALSLVAGTTLGVLAGAGWLAGGLGCLLLVLAAALLVGLAEAGAGPRTYLALALAPWYLLWKAAIQVRAVASLGRGVRTYAATPR